MRRFGRRGRMAGPSGTLRYAVVTQALTAAGTPASPQVATVDLPVAAIPRKLRIVANAVATARILVNNVDYIEVPSNPNGPPQEVDIPPGTFSQPVTSVQIDVINPATTGGSSNISIGY